MDWQLALQLMLGNELYENLEIEFVDMRSIMTCIKGKCPSHSISCETKYAFVLLYLKNTQTGPSQDSARGHSCFVLWQTSAIFYPCSPWFCPGAGLRHCRSFPGIFGFQHGHRGSRGGEQSVVKLGQVECMHRVGVRHKASHISEGHGNWRSKYTRIWTFLQWNCPGAGPSSPEKPSWLRCKVRRRWLEGQGGNISRDSAALPEVPSIFFLSHLPVLY